MGKLKSLLTVLAATAVLSGSVEAENRIDRKVYGQVGIAVSPSQVFEYVRLDFSHFYVRLEQGRNNGSGVFGLDFKVGDKVHVHGGVGSKISLGKKDKRNFDFDFGLTYNPWKGLQLGSYVVRDGPRFSASWIF